MEDLIYAEGQSPPKTVSEIAFINSLKFVILGNILCPVTAVTPSMRPLPRMLQSWKCPQLCTTPCARGKAEPWITPEHVGAAGTGTITP